jgi:hypothetical protein
VLRTITELVFEVMGISEVVVEFVFVLMGISEVAGDMVSLRINLFLS